MRWMIWVRVFVVGAFITMLGWFLHEPFVIDSQLINLSTLGYILLVVGIVLLAGTTLRVTVFVWKFLKR